MYRVYLGDEKLFLSNKKNQFILYIFKCIFFFKILTHFIYQHLNEKFINLYVLMLIYFNNCFA